MASGRLFIPGWMPARDSNGDPIPNVIVSFYQNETDVLASVYADEALTVPLTNPVAANSSGRFPQIYASDAMTYSASVDAPYGPAGQPFTFDGLQASQAADIAAANLAQGAAEDAEAALAATEAAIDAATQVGGGAAALAGALAGATAGTAAANAVVAGKLNTDASNPTNKDTVKSNLDIINLKPGPTTPVAGSRMSAQWAWKSGNQDGTFQGGQWAGPIKAGWVLSKEYTSADTSPSEVPAPAVVMTAFANGTSITYDVLPLQTIATAMTNNSCVFGGNTITANTLSSLTGVKQVIWEFDQQWAPGSTPSGLSGGVFISTFGATNAGNALYLFGHGGGTWSNGIKLAGINPTIGAGLSMDGGQTIGSLVNTTQGTYSQSAIELGAGEGPGIRIHGPIGDGTDAAQIFNSGGFLIIRGGSNPTVFQRHDGANTLLIESGGSLDLTAAGTVYKAQGIQVVGPRKTGWTADTGTAKRTANATYAGTAEVAYTQATIQALMNEVRDFSQTVKALKDDLISHGLLGS